MSNYFAGVTDIETLRKRYRELLKKYHPDNGGSVSEMQSINAEYDRLFDDLSKVNLSDIKAKYGCQTVRNQSYQYSLN